MQLWQLSQNYTFFFSFNRRRSREHCSWKACSVWKWWSTWWSSSSGYPKVCFFSLFCLNKAVMVSGGNSVNLKLVRKLWTVCFCLWYQIINIIPYMVHFVNFPSIYKTNILKCFGLIFIIHEVLWCNLIKEGCVECLLRRTLHYADAFPKYCVKGKMNLTFKSQFTFSLPKKRLLQLYRFFPFATQHVFLMLNLLLMLNYCCLTKKITWIQIKRWFYTKS